MSKLIKYMARVKIYPKIIGITSVISIMHEQSISVWTVLTLSLSMVDVSGQKHPQYFDSLE